MADDNLETIKTNTPVVKIISFSVGIALTIIIVTFQASSLYSEARSEIKTCNIEASEARIENEKQNEKIESLEKAVASIDGKLDTIVRILKNGNGGRR